MTEQPDLETVEKPTAKNQQQMKINHNPN